MKEGLNKALIKVANSKLANSTIQKVDSAVRNAIRLTKKLAMALKAVITHITYRLDNHRWLCCNTTRNQY